MVNVYDDSSRMVFFKLIETCLTLGAFLLVIVGGAFFTSHSCSDDDDDGDSHYAGYCSGYALGAMDGFVGLGLGYFWTLFCFLLFPIFDVGPEQKFHFALTILWIVTSFVATFGLIYWGVLTQLAAPYVSAVFACCLGVVFIVDLIIVQKMY